MTEIMEYLAAVPTRWDLSHTAEDSDSMAHSLELLGRGHRQGAADTMQVRRVFLFQDRGTMEV
jgi:hypothetical protein